MWRTSAVWSWAQYTAVYGSARIICRAWAELWREEAASWYIDGYWDFYTKWISPSPLSDPSDSAALFDMMKDSSTVHTETVERSDPQHEAALAHIKSLETGPVMDHVQDYQEAEHINLSWRSWMVVFVTCFAIMAQVFVVVAAGSVIAFSTSFMGYT